ncbi:Chloroquine-resistance transporter-like [Dillenia turbinata]|uniref:Chloroquine-resistance transporter-like n=1 Tax=Dillenia turbinata TaxID=194707 RepID=A0AAN8W2E8_9MAGN
MGFSCSQCLLVHSLRSNSLSHNIINESNFKSLILNPRHSPLLLTSNSSPFDGQFKFFSHTRNKFPFQQRSLLRKNSQVRVRASIENSHFSSQSQARIILANSALTVILASANRVLYKLALVPMKHYPFFLAQFNTFGYVAIYFSILYARFQAGVVTKEMLAIPKSRFAIIGMLEALGVATGMASGVHFLYLFTAMLPGPAIPILNQTFLVWQLIFSTLLLGRRYSFNQIVGCLLVASGVVIAVASGSSADQMLSGVEFIWPALMIASAAFQAGASIIKESVFIDASKRMKGKLLDIFVVNSFGSGFQVVICRLSYAIYSIVRLDS